MSKELYIACHEALIEEYLEENGLDDDHYQAAYEATADAAYGRMQDVIADRSFWPVRRRLGNRRAAL
jgi:predicted metal-dependent hydrolase